MKLKIRCDWCGKEFLRDSAFLKGKKHHFCCRQCLADFSSKSKNPDGYASLKDFTNIVAAHLFWLQINLIDCHRINRYNDISIEKEKVPEHLFFCRDKCSGTIYKHGYYIKIRNRIQ